MKRGVFPRSRTPTLDTYELIEEEHPEEPDVRRFIFPECRKIIINLCAPDGKIDRLIRTGTDKK